MRREAKPTVARHYDQPYRLIGYPLDHSLSPRIHSYWIKQYSMDADYKLFTTPPARVRQVVKRLRDKQAVGFNVTIPHKLAVMEYLDHIDATAMRIGAVNTVIIKTASRRALTRMRTGSSPICVKDSLVTSRVTSPNICKNVLVIGAGGATRAAIVALMDAGANPITLTNRSADKAQALANEFSCTAIAWERKMLHFMLQHYSSIPPALACSINHHLTLM
jgi:Shikimate 5-dehydrogenase